MKNFPIKAFIALLLLCTVGYGAFFVSRDHITSSLDKRLIECGSFPNGSTQRIVETTRMFINVPKDFYPNINLRLLSNGATASYISNAGPYGSAVSAQRKQNCWSYYFEFDGTGTIDLISTSSAPGIPDYRIHFIVGSSTAKS